jgi:protein SCO1/2
VILRFLAAALCALLLAGCAGSDIDWAGTDITGIMPDLSFELTSQKDEAVTADDLTGEPLLLFFGWIQCPDICPGTLQAIHQAIAALPEDQQDELRVLFVSVDPQRDTPEKLADYTGFFGPQFIGMTGTESQLRDLAKRYRTTYGYGDPDENGYYAVSHSAAIYGFDREGQARVLIKNNQPTDQMTADIRRLLAL